MFEWFKNKNKESSNVVPFPEPKSVPKMPEVKPPEKPAVTFYRIGMTDNQRVSFQMGYNEITMNYDGVDNLIKQLEVFRDQLPKEEVEQ